jgi:MFS family permease
MVLSDSVINHKPFALFLLARVSTALAYQMFSVAIGWQMYSVTGSVFYLGLVGLFQFLPMFLLTLPAGHAADQYNRKTIIRICQTIEGVGLAALAIGSYNLWLQKENILVMVFIIAAARAFEGPATQALMPGLIDRKHFPQAMAWSSSAFQTSIIIGPAIGGLLYAIHPFITYAISSVLLFTASIFVYFIRFEHTIPVRAPVTLESILAGISYIKSKPIILGAISLDLFAVLLGGATALLPAYAKDILKIGPVGLGILRAAPAAGALLVSVLLARKPLRSGVGKKMFAAVAIFGIVTILFGLSRSFAVSLATLIVLGGADVVSVVIRQSLVQLQTPDEMRGRVSAVNSMFIGTSNQLGEFESGITAAWFGLIPAVLIGGVGTLVVVGVWIFLFPTLFRSETLGAGEVVQ